MSVSDTARGQERAGIATPAITGPSHIRMHVLFGDGPWACTFCHRALQCPCTASMDSLTFWRERHRDGATIGYITPPNRGGGDGPDNVVPACQQCNSSKIGRIWPHEWVPGDLNDATYVYRASVAPRWGDDSLKVVGLVTVLAHLNADIRYPLADVAELVDDGRDVIRAALSKLAWMSRLNWRVVEGATRPYEHEFFGVNE
ncbi:HNH endonuclease [Nonomuraea sp. NPDC026600]|uniref:HNH endonuclease n=1 Tax=Nonomuraea sp. NPDC026600 TaxID=3155363 RepID=UPI0033E80E4E